MRFGLGLICVAVAFNMTAEDKAERLVNLHRVDATFVIEAKYATADNFLGVPVYKTGDLFLLRFVAEDLAAAQRELAEYKLKLKIWDGYRPHSIQERMWRRIPDARYVADPKRGSNHNRGCAVDVTLVDWNGAELPMPTKFDDFTERAHRDYNALDANVIKNRQLLSDVMERHNFVPFPTEWWHFDHRDCSKYPVLDIDVTRLQ